MPAMVDSWRSIGAGDGSRHGIGAGARQGRGHGDGRKIDLGKRRNRQQPEAEHAERDDRRRHAASSSPGGGYKAPRASSIRPRPCASRGSTGVPSDNSNWPSMTTSSPPDSPSAMTDMPLKGTADLYRLHVRLAVLARRTRSCRSGCAALPTVGTRHRILGPNDELGVDQNARPQRFVVVVHDAAHGDHAGGGIHGIFDHRDLAVFRLLVTGDGRDHLGLSGRHRLAQIDQYALRNGEGDIDRRHLVDDRERRGIGGADEIADLHIGGADPSGERRADDGVALLDLQIVQCRLIGLDGADQNIGLGLGIVDD